MIDSDVGYWRLHVHGFWRRHGEEGARSRNAVYSSLVWWEGSQSLDGIGDHVSQNKGGGNDVIRVGRFS